MGLNLWLLCAFESRHTRHTGSSWSKQKSLSFSACRLQRASDAASGVSALSALSSTAVLHRFLSTKLTGGSVDEGIFMQSGQVWVSFSFHHNCRHSLQKLWLHERMTGSLKISWQIEQVSSFSDSDCAASLPWNRSKPAGGCKKAPLRSMAMN